MYNSAVQQSRSRFKCSEGQTMNNNWATLVSLLCITAGALGQQQSPPKPPQPAPEMQSLTKAFEGKWRISEKYEHDEWTPNGGVGVGEEVWRRGPGGFTFMEVVHNISQIGRARCKE